MKVITKKEKNRCTFTLMDENWTDTFSLDFDTGIFYDSVYAQSGTMAISNYCIYFYDV